MLFILINLYYASLLYFSAKLLEIIMFTSSTNKLSYTVILKIKFMRMIKVLCKNYYYVKCSDVENKIYLIPHDNKWTTIY